MTDANALSTAEAWTDTDYSTALIHLRRLQDQLNGLRAILPNLIQPLTLHHSSPESLFLDFKLSASHAVHSLKSFKSQWEDPETTRILELVRARKEGEIKSLQSSRLILDRDEGYEKILSLKHPEKKETEIEDKVQQIEENIPEDLQLAIRDFQDQNTDAVCEWNHDDSVINIHVPVGVGRFQFTIFVSKDSPISYRVTCIGESKLCKAVTSAFDRRSNKYSLRLTLNHIAAYKDLFSRQCAACTRLLDFEGMVPVLRIPPEKPLASIGTSDLWAAYHKHCFEQ